MTAIHGFAFFWYQPDPLKRLLNIFLQFIFYLYCYFVTGACLHKDSPTISSID